MFAAFDNFPALLIWLPLAGGLISFFIKSEKGARASAIVFSLLTMGVMMASLFFSSTELFVYNQVSYVWLPNLGSSFGLILDGLTRVLCLLTALVFPMVFLLVPAERYPNANRFYGLMLLTQCGLMGVFMATDALVFYLFWELALIPVYFLASIWGGEKRIKATFKFFIYTFVGSLFLLIGILYMYLKTSNGSFSLVAFYNVQLSAVEQYWMFLLFFIAFAIKMPLFPLAVKQFNTAIIVVIVVGIVYASLIAIYQDNIKKLIAYSSIAHIGLMAAGAFTIKSVAMNGAVLQMFSHGINIMALWIVADLIEKQTGVTKISDLGGIAKKAPKLTIFLVIAAFANIALPLTNAFIGEFMLFNGLYQFKPWIAAFAGLSIIFSAVYTLNMIKHVFYGEVATSVEGFVDINKTQVMVLTVITGLILFVGIYPDPFFKMMYETVGLIVNRYVTI